MGLATGMSRCSNRLVIAFKCVAAALDCHEVRRLLPFGFSNLFASLGHCPPMGFAERHALTHQPLHKVHVGFAVPVVLLMTRQGVFLTGG